MKKHLDLKSLIFILLAFLITLPVIAQKTEVTPVCKLQKIVVFTDKAMITKEATAIVKRGENIIRISGITSNLVDQSVQVNLMGQGDLGISEVAVEETFLSKTEQPELQKLQTKVNELNDQIKDGTNQISVINSLNEFLNKVNPFPQSQKVTITDMEVHTKFLEKSLSANLDRRVTIELKLKKLNEEKVALEKEMGNLGSEKNKSKSIVIHLISGSEKSGLKFGFTYLATAAGWMPQYEAKADYATSKIDFNYFASIWQSTGEDWIGANLEISTARPFVYGNTPELSGWYLDIYTPRAYMTKSIRKSEQMSAAPRPELLMQREEVQEDVNLFKKTEINEENTSFSFVLPRKVDIVSDGQPHRVSVATSNADATMTYYTVPKLIQNAFLKATMKNPFQFPLLTGSIGVFFDQKLVGTTSLNETVLPDGEINLSLGVDE
ncbi:MAG: mucoidy inhibitor MuiA family protein, partial [Mariniphaga sp.]